MDRSTRYYRGSRDTTSMVYDRLLSDLEQAIDCLLLVVWSLDPVRNQLILRSVRKLQMSEMEVPILDCFKSFSGEAVEGKRIFDFPDVTYSIETEKKLFGNTQLIPRLGLRRMICIPIFNTVNINQVS